MNFIAQGKDNEALALLGTISASDGKAYGFLKELQKAYILSKDSDGNVRTQATAVYEGMMGNNSLPVIVKDLARLLAAKSHAAQKTKTADEIISLLEPLRGDKNPLHHMAREFIAEQLYFKGDKKVALELFAELALSTRTDVKGEAQSALIPSAPFGITGTVLSYLPVREIIGIHKQYPTEGREVAYGLSITPSPIFWNFHDSLYSRERFRDIFGRMGSQGNIALKLINLNVETLMMIAPLTILCAITRSVRQSPWQRRSICFGTPHSTSPSALKCGHKCF